ncbi:MAG: oxidoreductase domain protein [Phycisphaerales bacterium]|nr:oxidoreductase domain protein [Phycisphaerales bacterium]
MANSQSLQPVRVGIIGAGKISAAYLEAAKNLPILQVVAIADLNLEAARAKAKEFNVAKACSVEDLLADPAIELVLNLTIPAAHVPLGIKALDAGKHVFGEKPLGIDVAEAKLLIDRAKFKNLRVGSAPDTFLGAGLQTARKVIDDGGIGKPVAFTAFMISRGHENWHPSPEFYYQPGGGPMLDMGPYYITALLNLLGPVAKVSGMASISQPTRTITSQPLAGKVFNVTTHDHVVGTMQFTNGAVGSVIQSFAMRAGSGAASPIVIYGTEGTIHVPDPNAFDGVVKLCRFGEGKDEFVEVPHAFPTGYGRSVGLADLATAIRTHRPHRCGGEQALAALEIMQAFTDSSESGRAIKPHTPYERPAPMATGLPFGTLD